MMSFPPVMIDTFAIILIHADEHIHPAYIEEYWLVLQGPLHWYVIDPIPCPPTKNPLHESLTATITWL